MVKERSAGIVIVSLNGNFLLLNYTAGHWDFSKGHVEKGESDIEAAKRELNEETRISNVALISGFKESLSYFFTLEKQKIFKEVVFFLGTVESEKVRLSDEHIGFEWLPYEAALNRITFKTSRNILRKAKVFLHQHG